MSGRAIVEATVSVQRRITRTDSNGRYSISDLERLVTRWSLRRILAMSQQSESKKHHRCELPPAILICVRSKRDDPRQVPGRFGDPLSSGHRVAAEGAFA